MSAIAPSSEQEPWSRPRSLLIVWQVEYLRESSKATDRQAALGIRCRINNRRILCFTRFINEIFTYPMRSPSLTIITPNYNSGDKLFATVRSVQEQEVDLECLIVDGKSSDQSIEIARALEREHPEWLRVTSQKDRGVYDAMNFGITSAKGRYLYFLGAGDVLYPHVLKQIIAALPSNDRTLVYGDICWRGHRYNGRFTARKLRTDNLPHQAAFYGREIFRIVGTYELKYKLLADWALNLAVFGNRRIPRKYVDVLVAVYEGGGLSDSIEDTAFSADRTMLWRRLGWWVGLHANAHHLAAGLYRRILKDRSLLLQK